MCPAFIQKQRALCKMEGEGEKKKGRTSAVELERRLEGYLFLDGLTFRVLLFSGIQAVNIRLMVLRVVQRHDLLGDMRLKSVVSVR